VLAHVLHRDAIHRAPRLWDGIRDTHTSQDGTITGGNDLGSGGSRDRSGEFIRWSCWLCCFRWCRWFRCFCWCRLATHQAPVVLVFLVFLVFLVIKEAPDGVPWSPGRRRW
jgi:hypothetical protein